VAVARYLTGAGGSRNTGLFTLVLHRTIDGWKIITDHSPYVMKAAPRSLVYERPV
jgi:ketosteroid isomerase-like protein